MAFPIFLNGRFLTQKLSGVQRYAREMVRSLDALIAEDEGGLGRFTWTLLAPARAACDLPLRRIGFRTVGRVGGHLWDQAVLPFAASGGVLVSLANSGPVLHRRQIVVLHDAAVFRLPENFGHRYVVAHRLLGRALSRTAWIGTVSHFSRRELSEVLGLPEDRIFVARNGAEHLRSQEHDVSVLTRLGLTPERYFLFVGTPARNKNLALAIEAFARLERPDAKLALVGALSQSVFRDGLSLAREGVVQAGRLPDPEIAALYRCAAALVFPSLYEGFGIPPLEAMVNDCPVLASAIPPVREVCGNAADYFEPTDASGLARLMRERLDRPDARPALVERGRRRAANFTWRDSARRLADAIVARVGC